MAEAIGVTFRGWPESALDFFDGLEADNSKAYWTAHKKTYDQDVRAPMQELLDAVAGEFGTGTIFRPYRDTRFSKDKAPYKTNIGAALGQKQGQVFYVHLDRDGLLVAGGMHSPASDQVERLRAAVADDRIGRQLETLVADLEKAKFEIGGEELKTAPRGYPKDHTRIRLLRHKGVYAWQQWAPTSWLHTAKVLDRVVTTWRATQPLNAWLGKHVGASRLPPDRR